MTARHAAGPWPHWKQWHRGLGVAVIALSVLSFAVASILPVYTDEITWSAILGRLNYDHGKSLTITLQPTCERFYARDLSAIMWWPRWLNTYLVNALTTPLHIRVWGVLCAFTWLGLTTLLLSRLFTEKKHLIFALVLAWSTFGVQPFLLVLSRPEQVLLIGTTVFLLLGLRPPVCARTRVGEAYVAFAALAGYWYVIAAHPRGLFVAPLASVFAYRLILWTPLRWILITCQVAVTIFVFQAWKPLWGCSQDPQFAKMLAFSNFGTAHAIGMDRAFWNLQLSWLRETKGWFLQEFAPKPEYASNIIPPFDLPHARVLRDAIEATCLLLLAGGFACCCLAIRAWAARRKNLSLLVLVLSAWLIYFVNVLVRVEKNEYEAAYIEPLMGLLVFCSAWVYLEMAGDKTSGPSLRIRQVFPLAQLAVLLLSIVSQACFLDVYVRDARSNWLSGGQPPGQHFSVSVAESERVAAQVRSAARECSIDPDKPQYHLVVDESSYFVFRRTNEPLFAAYFDDRGWGSYRPDPTSLFHALHSSGMVAYCNRIPKIYGSEAKREGELCCMPAF